MDEVLSKFPPSTHVMKIHDPLHIGIVCDSEPMERGNEIMLLVNFGSGQELIPISQLKTVNEYEVRSTPISLLQNGRLGDHKDFRRALVYTRFSGKLENVIYSMEATNTDFHAYQFKPVLKMLDSPSNSLLIADEVGLGKTIEAGLIWTELRSRRSLNKLWIVCPPPLCEKWKDELFNKMNVSAIICDATEAFKILSNESRREQGFAIITSMHGLRPPKNWNDEEENPKAYKSARAKLARFLNDMKGEKNIIDMLIVDEAHHMRNSRTQTNKIGELLRDVSEYLVFLSATPIHNRNEDLLSLLNLLDAEAFDSKDALNRILEANEPLVNAIDMINKSDTDVEELKSILESAKEHPLLKDSEQLEQLLPKITKENLDILPERIKIAHSLEKVNLLGNAVTRTRKKEVQEFCAVRIPDDGTTEMSNVEKKFYEIITEAIRDYAEEKGIHEGFVLAMPQRQMTSSMAAAYKSWDDRILDDEESLDYNAENKEDKESSGELIKKIVETVKGSGVILSDLEKNDSKFNKLQEKIYEYWEKNRNKKIIIFSTFRGTLAYLGKRFHENDIKTTILQGGGKVPKEKIINDFEKSDDIKILLSSEVGGEGVDLQFCDIVINYDLPWNPMRLEQRIGRIDRLGQKSEKITILNLLNEGTIDFKIYTLLYEKLEKIHRTFGEFESILGDSIKKITDIYLTQKLSDEELDKQLKQSQGAAERKKYLEDELENEAFHLVAHGEHILNQIKNTRQMKRWISKHDLYKYTYDFLSTNYKGCDFTPKDDKNYEFNISLSSDAQFDLLTFIREKKMLGQTQLTNASSRVCKFENRPFGRQQGNKEIISQFHPLIAFITEKISKSDKQIYPAVVFKLPKQSLEGELEKGVYILVASLWSIKGLTDIEKLNYALAKLDSLEKQFTPDIAEKLARVAIYEGKLWVDYKEHYKTEEVVNIANKKFAELDSEYNKFFNEEKARNGDRARIQINNLDAKTRKQEEVLRSTIETNKQRGQSNLVKANEARLEILLRNYDHDSRLIKERMVMKQDSSTDICIAIISVE